MPSNPAAKLGGFALLLGLVFGGATLAGRAIDPFSDAPAPAIVPVHTEHEGGP